MGEVFKFTPKGDDAVANFEDYIAAGKSMPFIPSARFVWDDEEWDLSGLAKHSHAGRTPRIHFNDLVAEFGAFGRAMVAHRIGAKLGEVLGFERYAGPLSRLREVSRVASDLNVVHPIDVTLEVFDKVISEMNQEGQSLGAVRNKQHQLVQVYQALENGLLLRRPFRWEPTVIRSQGARRRVNQEKPGRGLTDIEVDAIARLFRCVEYPKDIVIASTLVLLCCAPMRVSEVFALPADAEVIQHPGDGLRAGIRWQPAKGGAPQIKYIPEAMVPIAKEALARIREATEPARQKARNALVGTGQERGLPKDFPVFDNETGLTYDKALYVFIGGMGNANYFLLRLTHSQFGTALAQAPIFDRMGIFGPEGELIRITTHQPRHYLNGIANRSNVPQADIALWSGRKFMTQNTAYDHETAEELVQRIKAKRGPENLPEVQIADQEAFDVSLIKEAAHTTQFGWCMQSLRQDPCQMYGKCLNCKELVCVKGAIGKLENIKAELAREEKLHDLALLKKAQGLKIKDRWIELYEKNIERLTQLIAVMEDPRVEDGSLIRLADAGPEKLPQFDMTAFGKARENSVISNESQPQRGLFDGT